MNDKSRIHLGIVGVGQIARAQHIPAIENNPDVVLRAAASHEGTVEGIPNFRSIEDMVDTVDGITAVALCMPPQHRFNAAKFACDRGLDTLLEKPPGAGVSEVRLLETIAERHNVCLFGAWHSRFNDTVESARVHLHGRRVTSARIVWNEDVRHWHTGQDWIWKTGGMGVFDSGVNALSVLTFVHPLPMMVTRSRLFVPENRSAPIAAEVTLCDANGATIDVELDWRVRNDDTRVEIETTDSRLVLTNRARELEIDGVFRESTANTEYPAVYRRFVDLIRSRSRCVDSLPLQIVADAFLVGEVENTDVFPDD